MLRIEDVRNVCRKLLRTNVLSRKTQNNLSSLSSFRSSIVTVTTNNDRDSFVSRTLIPAFYPPLLELRKRYFYSLNLDTLFTFISNMYLFIQDIISFISNKRIRAYKIRKLIKRKTLARIYPVFFPCWYTAFFLTSRREKRAQSKFRQSMKLRYI